jgi:hypothetical protein
MNKISAPITPTEVSTAIVGTINNRLAANSIVFYYSQQTISKLKLRVNEVDRLARNIRQVHF